MTGLAAFLGRVTGVSFVIGKLHKHRDAQRFAAYRAEKAALVEKQKEARRVLAHRQKLQTVDAAREVRALTQIEARELKSFEVAQRRAERVRQRQGHDHMPALNLALKPRGRSAVPHKAKDRYRKRDDHHHRDDDHHVDRAALAALITINKTPPAAISKLRAAFEASMAQSREEKGRSEGEKEEGRRDGRGGGDERRRARGRDHEERVQDDVSATRDFTARHWTELPLADEFREAARDRDIVERKGESDGARIRRSRSSRGRARDDDGPDIERER